MDDATKVADELRMEHSFLADLQALESERDDQLVRSIPYRKYRKRYIHDFGHAAEESVYRHLIHQYSTDLVVVLERGPFDFLIKGSSFKLAVEVKAFPQRASKVAHTLIQEVYVRAFYHLSKGLADDYRLYLVAPDEETGMRLVNMVFGGPPPNPAYPTSVGIIGLDGSYVEIAQQYWA